MTNLEILEICGQAQNQDEALVMLMKHGLNYTDAKAEMEKFFKRMYAELNAEQNCMVNV